jgi:ribosomal protein S18 acetylase RimI-like enzyme
MEGRDLPDTAAVMARAYAADPYLRWLTGREDFDPDDGAALMSRLLDGHAKHGSITVGDRTRQIVGAAIWAPSDHARLSARRRLGVLIGMVGRVELRAARILAAGHPVDRRPSHRHRHLVALGVEPEDRHRGVGTRLLQAGLALCDAAVLPAYSEVTDPGSAAFLERFRFEVYDHDRIAPGATLWRMWRQPA